MAESISGSRIREAVDPRAVIPLMRDALMAHSRGESVTPMPMHLDMPPAEVHIKCGYRRGGGYFVLKAAGSFASGCNGAMLLFSAATGDLVAVLQDNGYLTDLRTAAAAAMTTRELGRTDRTLGILGTGVQARLTALMHAQVLELDQILIWGRNPERLREARRDIHALAPGVLVSAADSAAQVAANARLLVTCTASRAPLLRAADLQPGTHIHAVGADSPGKQELDPQILQAAPLLLADSLSQCARLGELQHCAAHQQRAVEIGEFCARPMETGPDDWTVADFTGLGIEDLFVAAHAYERITQGA
ncbi:MAG: hypothetical protein K2X35_05855 [Bryobacteraceae bacterium]|nr:hypothetical protein [Bryobacteraceae bacterium]